MNPLINFHLGIEPDHRGRRLVDILNQNDDWLERTHDYIQWLFPLWEPSSAAPRSPTLDADVVKAFHEDASLRRALRSAFLRMLSFYGLEWQDEAVRKGGNWVARQHDWFTRPTHNDLRITRILRSLSVLGLGAEAAALLAGLERLRREEADCGVSEETWEYWRRAVRS